jgi:hypothetical protein
MGVEDQNDTKGPVDAIIASKKGGVNGSLSLILIAGIIERRIA